VLRALSLCTCCRHYPGAAAGRRRRSSHPTVSAFPDNVVGSACTSSFSRIAQRSLALRPAHSRGHLYVTCYTEGSSHFVTSMTAPVASGWSGCRVGLAPTGKRRLLTAHANSGHSWVRFQKSRLDRLRTSGGAKGTAATRPTPNVACGPRTWSQDKTPRRFVAPASSLPVSAVATGSRTVLDASRLRLLRLKSVGFNPDREARGRKIVTTHFRRCAPYNRRLLLRTPAVFPTPIQTTARP
jgi:hypothetical protein